MRCYRARKLISLSLDKELDERGRKALESHMEACPTCAAIQAAWQKAWSAMASKPPVPPVPADLLDSLIARMDRPQKAAQKAARQMPRRLVFVQAAGVVVSLILGVSFGLFLSEPRAGTAGKDAVMIVMPERKVVKEAFEESWVGWALDDEGGFQCDPR